MTMASWSEPASVTTSNPNGRHPDTNAWSMRRQRSEPGHGPQVRRGFVPCAVASTSAASVRWDAIRRYAGQDGVALKSPIKTLRGDGARTR